jgi:flagellar assembly factor FliW
MIATLTREGTATMSTEGTDLPVLEFADGLPGFASATRFVLVRLDDAGQVLDLQSVDEPSLRFVVVPSVVFFPDYAPEIDDATVSRLGLADPGSAPLVLLVVTVGASLAESTANLMAPIVVNTAAQRAAQVVLDDSSLPLRAPLTG